MDQSTFDLLTAAEKDVLRRLAAGRRPGEVAADLGRSLSTIRNQLQSARSKAASSDSVALARSLVEFEGGGQNVPRHTLPMDATTTKLPASAHRQQSTDPSALTFREARAAFQEDVAADWQDRTDEQKAPRHDLINHAVLKLILVLGIAVLAMMCVALAPDMGNTAQRIANRLYPTHR